MDLHTLLKPEIQQFIKAHETDDPAALMLQSRRFLGMPFAEVVQQISARQKARKKLPEWYRTPKIVFPPGISMEQCSSEATARFKAGLVSGSSAADITGGFGVDCYYLSQQFGHMFYVEQNPELAQLAAHNFEQLKAKNISVNAAQAHEFLKKLNQKLTCIYLDPARRDKHQGKVFRLEDCEPNVLEMLPLLLAKADTILLKTAPLLDIDLAVNSLKKVAHVWVVAYAGECREVLYFLSENGSTEPEFSAVDLSDNLPARQLSFTRRQEADSKPEFSEPLNFLYEPNAAILKAGAFKSVAEIYQAKKLHPSSHLYTSDKLIPDFPGRIFAVKQVLKYARKEVQAALPGAKANITTRNFPDSVAAIRKKTGLKEGVNFYLFATTEKTGKPILVVCEKP